MSRFRRLILLFVASTITCTSVAQKSATPVMFAPYVDVSQIPNGLLQIHKDSGIRFFTLAFVNASSGCAPVWPGGQLVEKDQLISGYVDRLRTVNGDVIIAFGGYEGTELAQACGDVTSLQSAYQQVVDKYHAKILDFDIEHLAIEDQISIDRRNVALKNLAHANPGLQINFTLPATPAGLTARAMNVLGSAIAQGTPIHLVNVMAMNYGATAQSEMGENAISAINGAQNQLKELKLNAALGITPMIGVNDVAGETFTIADAASVLSYVKKNPAITLLAFWSATRDNGSCAATVSPTCSGLSQKPWEFAHLFLAPH